MIQVSIQQDRGPLRFFAAHVRHRFAGGNLRLARAVRELEQHAAIVHEPCVLNEAIVVPSEGRHFGRDEPRRVRLPTPWPRFRH
jgi:hypothetical protein